MEGVPQRRILKSAKIASGKRRLRRIENFIAAMNEERGMALARQNRSSAPKGEMGC